MTTIPNPSTTEWIPLWDLNATSAGGGGTLGPHHTTHELGGTDIIQNVAWLSQPNIFTAATQTINAVSPGIYLIDTAQPIDGKLFRILNVSQKLYFQATNDAVTISTGVVTIDRSGILTAPGLGTTPLNASNLTSGIIPDARLSTNVALLNVANIFTQNQKITGTRPTWEIRYTGNPVSGRFLQAIATNRLDISSNLFHDGTNWNADDITQIGLIYAQQAGRHDFYTTTVTPNPRVVTLQLSITTTGTTIPAGLGTTPLNASNLTSGIVPDTCLSANVPLINKYNIFTATPLGISAGQPEIRLYDTSSPANSRMWRIIDTGALLYFQATDDAITVQQTAIIIDRTGALYAPGGLSTTPLNASNLTSGTVPLARLPPYLTQDIGSWLPIIGGEGGQINQDYKYQQGAYIKIGRLVHVWSYTQFRGPGGGGDGHVGAKGTITGNLIITNLPFICITTTLVNPPNMGGVVSYYSNLQTTNNPNLVGINCYVLPGHSWGYLMKLTPGNNPQHMSGADGTGDINDDTQMMIAVSYLTD